MELPDLHDWYLCNGVPEGVFCIGPEHPAMENLAISLLEKMKSKRVLEIGYQSGGFAIPLITYFASSSEFHYTGIDNLEYDSSCPASFIDKYLNEVGVSNEVYKFENGDAKDILCGCNERYDLILIDHVKALYVRELKTILKKQLINETGVILLHDVNVRARKAWSDCQIWCNCYNCLWEVHDEVESGLAIVSSRNGYKSKGIWKENCCEVKEVVVKIVRRCKNILKI